MFIFGHLGFGSTLARPWRKVLPWGWLLLGTQLPDLIDKTLYYGLSWKTGLHGADLGLISCTRTIGHTGLLCAFWFLLAWMLRSPACQAVAAGNLTHIVLDNLPDVHGGPPSSANIAFLFPFYLQHFDIMQTTSAADHLHSLFNNPYILVTEVMGVVLLCYWIRRDRLQR